VRSCPPLPLLGVLTGCFCPSQISVPVRRGMSISVGGRHARRSLRETTQSESPRRFCCPPRSESPRRSCCPPRSECPCRWCVPLRSESPRRSRCPPRSECPCRSCLPPPLVPPPPFLPPSHPGGLEGVECILIQQFKSSLPETWYLKKIVPGCRV
jgi:hypothetical protein